MGHFKANVRPTLNIVKYQWLMNIIGWFGKSIEIELSEYCAQK